VELKQSPHNRPFVSGWSGYSFGYWNARSVGIWVRSVAAASSGNPNEMANPSIRNALLAYAVAPASLGRGQDRLDVVRRRNAHIVESLPERSRFVRASLFELPSSHCPIYGGTECNVELILNAFR
jgi:hypothetical protein